MLQAQFVLLKSDNFLLFFTNSFVIAMLSHVFTMLSPLSHAHLPSMLDLQWCWYSLKVIWDTFSQCHALLWRKFDSAGTQVDSTLIEGQKQSLGYDGIQSPWRRSHFVFGQVPKNAGGYDFIQPGRRSIFVFGQVPKNTGACVLGIRSCFGRLMGRLG